MIPVGRRVCLILLLRGDGFVLRLLLRLMVGGPLLIWLRRVLCVGWVVLWAAWCVLVRVMR